MEWPEQEAASGEDRLGFGAFALSRIDADQLAERGFDSPTGLQGFALPRLLDGGSGLILSPSGSGRIALAGMVAAERVDRTQMGLQALVLVPGPQEVLEVAGDVARVTGWPSSAILAVQPGLRSDRIGSAIRRGAVLAVGTPSRVLDLAERRSLSLDLVRLVVVLETDLLLTLGARPALDKLAASLPDTVQAVLSAGCASDQLDDLAAAFGLRTSDTLIPPASSQWAGMKERILEVAEDEKLDFLAAMCRRAQADGRGLTVMVRSSVWRDRVREGLAAKDAAGCSVQKESDAARSMADGAQTAWVSYHVPLDPTAWASRPPEKLTVLVTPAEYWDLVRMGGQCAVPATETEGEVSAIEEGSLARDTLSAVEEAVLGEAAEDVTVPMEEAVPEPEALAASEAGVPLEAGFAEATAPEEAVPEEAVPAGEALPAGEPGEEAAHETPVAAIPEEAEPIPAEHVTADGRAAGEIRRAEEAWLGEEALSREEIAAREEPRVERSLEAQLQPQEGGEAPVHEEAPEVVEPGEAAGAEAREALVAPEGQEAPAEVESMAGTEEAEGAAAEQREAAMLPAEASEPLEPSGQVPAEQAPVEQAPGEQASAGEAPAESEPKKPRKRRETAARQDGLTEAERVARRHIKRDAARKIERIDPEEAAKEAERLVRESVFESVYEQAYADQLAGEAPEAQPGDEEREEAARRRRLEVAARLDEARRQLAVSGLREEAPQEGVPAEVPSAPEHDPLTPAEERLIAFAQQTLDAVAQWLRGGGSASTVHRALAERLLQDADGPELAATLLEHLFPFAGPEEEAGNTARLFISLGRQAGVNQAQLIRLVEQMAGVQASDIGRADVLARYSFLEVNADLAEQIMREMNGKRYRGREIVVDRAKPPKNG